MTLINNCYIGACSASVQICEFYCCFPQILSDLGTYLHKAIPDTRLTIKRYADAKFEYLSYCLKVKEMDDEEIQFSQLQEPLYRVETGNYEYRYYATVIALSLESSILNTSNCSKIA